MLVSFNLIILLFVFLCLYGLVVSIKKDKVLAGREKRTLSVGSTNAVKGIAIIGIFISHMSQKIGGGVQHFYVSWFYRGCNIFCVVRLWKLYFLDENGG